MEPARPLQSDEFDSLMELVDTIFPTNQGHSRESFPLLFDCANWHNLFVSVDDGRVVSHVGMRLDDIIILGCRLKVASVGSVATYEDYRGRGLATDCLDAAERQAVSEGASVFLISGSRGLYGRFGATKVGRASIYSLPAGDAADSLFIQEAGTADIFTAARFYEREPVRFHRPLEDWKAAFAAMLAKHSSSFQDFMFLFGNSETVTGYVLVRRSQWGDAPVVRVTEYAGCRDHIVGVLPAVAAAIDADSIDIAVPDFDPVLERAAATTGLSPRTDFLFGHTVKISSLASFIRGLKPLFEERIGRTGAGGLAFQPGAGTYDVIIGEEHFPFPVPAFTALAFGTPDGYSFEDAGFGAGLLGRLFPVPLPFPGLNYV